MAANMNGLGFQDIGNTYPAVGFTTPDIKKYILIFLYQKIFKYQLKKQIKP
jgi:hypothetical protein